MNKSVIKRGVKLDATKRVQTQDGWPDPPEFNPL